MKSLAVLLVVGSLVLALGNAASAGVYASTDRCSYTGTLTKYATLADAQARTNPTGGPWTIPNRVTGAPYDTPWRDVGIYFVKDAPAFGSDFNYFTTDWWYSTPPNARYSGANNPNNTGVGFIQIYDDDSSTDTSFMGYFDPTLTQFTLKVTGQNATNAAEYARLWDAAGTSPNDRGTFHTYELNATFGGLVATWNAASALYEATGQPTSVSGTFKAVFESTSAANTFYVVDWTLGLDN
jgi:hypothetical protein